MAKIARENSIFVDFHTFLLQKPNEIRTFALPVI